AVLILTATQLFELLALRVTAHQAEQEARIGIPSADAGVTGRPGHAATERERASGITDFRLPVVQPQADEIEPAADFVATTDFSQVRGDRIAALVAPHGRPRVRVAQRSQPCRYHR